MTYSEIIDKVSEELGLPKDLVNRTYKAYWLFIRNQIETFPLKENISMEEFSKLRTNFNIPSLGKLSCTYDRMLNVKKRFNYIKQLENNGIKSKED